MKRFALLATTFAACASPAPRQAAPIAAAPTASAQPGIDAGATTASEIRDASAPRGREVRRKDGTLRGFYAYIGERAPIPMAAASETLATEFLAAHRAELGVGPDAHVVQRTHVAIDGDPSVGSMHTFEYVVDGDGAPCAGWQAQLDVSRLQGPIVTRLETFCANDPDLFPEERAVQSVLGGTLEPTSIGSKHPEWRFMTLRGRTMTRAPSMEHAADAILRALGADASAYVHARTEGTMQREYRLRPGGKGPCEGHRMQIETTEFRYFVVFACDGQPLGAACGTDRGTCMGGLTCKIEEQEHHYSRGKCVVSH